jgi:hypothetical protein
LQPPQRFEENGRRCFLANVTDDAAHVATALPQKRAAVEYKSALDCGLRKLGVASVKAGKVGRDSVEP